MEGSINITKFNILLTLFKVLAEERLLVEGGFPSQDAGCATRVDPTDEGVSGDEGVMSCRGGNPEVAVLSPGVGTLN